ncbi:MAG: Fe2+-dependent dioxygenase [Lysobacterales bacterium]
MLIVLEDVLSPALARAWAERLRGGEWRDGRASAGSLAAAVKSNQQLREDSALARELGQQLLARLGRHPGFLSAALPERILPPRFNRYGEGARYGLHVDAAVMHYGVDGAQTLRSDLSATLFLAEPDSYEGGELCIETEFGAQQVKLPAGQLVLYPSSSLHEVRAVTRGERLAAFFWIQSLVRDGSARSLLYDLDQSLQQLRPTLAADDARLVALTGVYHNLLRRWASP